MPPPAPPGHRSKCPRYLGDPLPPVRPPRARPARSWHANRAAVQTPAPSFPLPATCLAVGHSSSPAPSAATTRPPPLPPASSPRPPPSPRAVHLALPIAGTTIAPPIPNPPSCGRPPRTVPLACTEPPRSPLRAHQCPDSSRLRRGLLILSGTPLPRSPLRPLHNPPPSLHPADPQFAAA